ncbi:hypothetical protein TNCV_3312941 [Trichonephila clavipes]|nr:hypothetical protein TNCV_3312941 [Trichonephila clavipes]
MNRCPDLVFCLKRDVQCLRPQASLVLIYRPNVAGMKGRVDLEQPVNRTPDLWTTSGMQRQVIVPGSKPTPTGKGWLDNFQQIRRSSDVS